MTIGSAGSHPVDRAGLADLQLRALTQSEDAFQQVVRHRDLFVAELVRLQLFRERGLGELAHAGEALAPGADVIRVEAEGLGAAQLVEVVVPEGVQSLGEFSGGFQLADLFQLLAALEVRPVDLLARAEQKIQELGA